MRMIGNAILDLISLVFIAVEARNGFWSAWGSYFGEAFDLFVEDIDHFIPLT